MTSVDASRKDEQSAVDVVAGLMAVASLVLSGIACGLGLILEIDAHPTRTGIVAVILALAAARMSSRYQRLSLVAAVVAGVAWIVGMTLMVITSNPII